MRIAIIGAGGFGREIVDVLDASDVVNGHGIAADQIELLGFLDDGEPDVDRLAAVGVPLLGPAAGLSRLDAHFLIGIGQGRTRRQIDEQATGWGRSAATVAHRTSAVGRNVSLGPGAVLCAQATITTNVRAGRHLHLNLAATIGHDCVLGDYVTVSPGANISGNVSIGDEVLIGTNAALLPGVAVGDGATIGAGAVVTRDVPPGTTAVGAPARALRR